MKIKYLFWIVLFFSCKNANLLSHKKKQEKCMSKFHATLENRGALLLEAKEGTFNFDHEKVNAPEDWRNKKWNFEYGEVYALEAIDAKYFDYAQSLLNMENEIKNCQCAITTEDFKKHFKEPTQIGKDRDSIIYFYMMNNKRYPECYKEDALKGHEYSFCRLFAVKFDLEGTFKKVSIGTFGP